MSITLDQRPLTPRELDDLKGSTTRIWLFALPGVIARYVLVFLLLMGLGLTGVTMLDGVLRSAGAFALMQWQPGPWAIPLIVVGFWGPIVLIPVWFATRSLRRNLRRQRARTRDLVSGHACIARVEDARFIGLVSKQGGERLLFDIDGERGLLLDGERPRFDRALFGLPEWQDNDEDADEDDAPPEGAIGQTPFPNSRFELHWLPHSGRMLQIDARGEVATPLRVLLDNELSLPESTEFSREPECEVMLVTRRLDALLASARITA